MAGDDAPSEEVGNLAHELSGLGVYLKSSFG